MFVPSEIMRDFNRKYEDGYFKKDTNVQKEKGSDFSDKDFIDKKIESFKKLLDKVKVPIEAE